MKSPIHLLQLILTECGDRCGISTDRDFKRISARYEHEGFSFLGITLAKFGKDLQKSLDQGFVAPDQFAYTSKRAGLPELFRGFLEHVFEPISGRLLPDPCLGCIHSLRQISLMWAKVNAPATPEREKSAFISYKERENHVYVVADQIARRSLRQEWAYDPSLSGLCERRAFRDLVEDSPLLEYQRMSRKLFAGLFSEIDYQVANGEVVPGHGPGSTADSLSGNQKWEFAGWPERLEAVFPIWRYYYHSARAYLGSEGEYTDPGPELPVKVISVPKTLDKPRIIAMEPTAMQYMQQALKREFERGMDRPTIHGRTNYSHYLVRYASQVPNQVMARTGSEIQSLATLDLSDASDSVSNLLVQAMFADYGHLYDAVQATRSTHADVSGVGIIPLSKFASMGSALCFPIEALVFTTIVFVGIQRAMRRPLTHKLIQSFLSQVRVYGDDIIVPVEFALPVTEALESYGFTVSLGKSFWTGKFRESCGKDYYDGVDVSIVRLRRSIPKSREDTASLVSFVEFRNQLYKAGFWATVREVDRWIERLIPFPATTEGAAGLGKVSFLGYESQKWDSRLQRPLVKAAVVHTRKRKSPLSGEKALLKFFIHKELGNTEPLSEDHLQYSGRPLAVNIKLGWVHSDYGVDGV